MRVCIVCVVVFFSRLILGSRAVHVWHHRWNGTLKCDISLYIIQKTTLKTLRSWIYKILQREVFFFFLFLFLSVVFFFHVLQSNQENLIWPVLVKMTAQPLSQLCSDSNTKELLHIFTHFLKWRTKSIGTVSMREKLERLYKASTNQPCSDPTLVPLLNPVFCFCFDPVHISLFKQCHCSLGYNTGPHAES